MATEKLSATVDAEVLAQVRAVAGDRAFSAFVDQALRRELYRVSLVALLDELDRQDGPIPQDEVDAEVAAIRQAFVDKARSVADLEARGASDAST